MFVRLFKSYETPRGALSASKAQPERSYARIFLVSTWIHIRSDLARSLRGPRSPLLIYITKPFRSLEDRIPCGLSSP